MIAYHGEEKYDQSKARRALAAVESGLDWHLWLSKSGGVIDANSALCRELGYSLEELCSLPAAPFLEAKIAHTWHDKWQRLCVSESLSFNTCLLSKSGASFPVAVKACYLCANEDDDECAFLRISLDTHLSTRTASDQRATGNGWMYPSFYEAMSEGVAFHRVIFDDDGLPVDYIILDINSKYSEIVGFSREEVVGSVASELYGGESAPYLDIYAAVALSGKNSEFDVFYQPIGKWLHISVTSFQRGYFATLFSDVTSAMLIAAERESMLNEVCVKAAELDAAISSIASGIAICDATGKLTRINAEAYAILGYAINELPNSVKELVELLQPMTVDEEPLTADMFPFSTALGDSGLRKVIASVKRSDGKRIWVSYSSSPIKSPTRKILSAIVSFSDVTLRLQLQESLRVNEARLSAQLAEMDFLFEHTPVGLFSLDLDLNVLRYNQNFADIAGGPSSLAPGFSLGDVLPALAASVNGVRDALFADGKTVNNVELFDSHGDCTDQDRWWLASYYPRTDANGCVSGVLGAIIDITSRKTAETESRRNSSLLERAEEIVRLGYWEMDLESRAVWASDIALDIYGLEDCVVSIEEIQRLALPEYREKLDDALINLVNAGDTYDIEFQVKRRSTGEIVDVRSRAVYHREDRKVVGVVQDTTARRAVQSNLQKLSLAVEQNPASIVITDPEGTIEYVNPKFTDITGYTLEEAIGKNPRILKSDYSTPEMYADLWLTILSGLVWRGTLCNRKKNGDLYWESASISPIIDTLGRLTHFVAVKEDITQRVHADIELAALHERAGRRLTFLQAAHKVEVAIRKPTELSELIPVLVSEFMGTLNMDAAALWTVNTTTKKFAPICERWRPILDDTPAFHDLREPLIDSAAKTNKTIFAGSDECRALSLPEPVEGYGVLPLNAHGQLIGVLEFQICSPIAADDEWWNCLEMIAAVCALALHNTNLFEEVRLAHGELVGAYDATLEGWSRALDLRDRETEGHSRRVTAAAVKLAQRIGLHGDEVIHVRRGALLHDVGKLGVPDRILGKQGTLSPEEWEIMRMHPVYAYEWLSRIAFLSPALDIPRDHHEHWDGGGYPRGLQGSDIPVAARLFTIIDVWDALTHDRPYRLAWPKEKARSYLLSEAGKLFDPTLLGIFLELLDSGEIE